MKIIKRNLKFVSKTFKLTMKITNCFKRFIFKLTYNINELMYLESISIFFEFMHGIGMVMR